MLIDRIRHWFDTSFGSKQKLILNQKIHGFKLGKLKKEEIRTVFTFRCHLVLVRITNQFQITVITSLKSLLRLCYCLEPIDIDSIAGIKRLFDVSNTIYTVRNGPFTRS